MSVRITTNQNTVTVADADKSITIINNREPNRIDIVQPESDVIYVAALGPQGPAGTGGGGSSDLTALNSFSASILTFTGSIQTQVNNLTAATSSYVLTSATSSMIVSGALTASYYQETDPIFVAKSASLATTGSNTFVGNQIVSGSVTVLNDLTIFGSQSVVYITSSQLDISTNLITVNTSTPAVRFGGIAVRDSGSLATGLTGSLLWDSQNNVWIYSNPAGAAYDGGLLLAGPRNTSGLGNEVGINSWYAALGDGSHHMTSSQIYNSGSLIRLETNTQITGSLNVSAGITGSLLGTSSWAYSASQALTASYINTLHSSNFTASFGLSTTWTINHNLNTRYVIVQTFDSNHNQILPQEITLTNTNIATATFSQAESGYAVVTVGGALLNSTTPGGSSGQVQYNNGGAFGGDSKFTFNGTFAELYDGNGTYKALSTALSTHYTYTEQLNQRVLSTAYVTDFVGNEKFAGDMLVGTISATTYDLVFLQTNNTWLPIDQTDSAKATRMLGIYNGTSILIEGYVVVGENGVANNVPLVAGTLTPGAPIYIKQSATSVPFLDTTVPTSGVVRILGHLIRDEGSGYWFMKFRPDHTWVKI